ncbi:calmodulin-binding protein 60 B-like isoform X2 [Rhododendron vialii]|uniref:calmodulin-binding protein 60 B-like isoform X2 n=1 Tax=Rhododendron vialii TaxID=182163 RepID=UPI00265EB5C3|nr:calmodulin-binding protein 60 B-like isoform X2 [Rhododendron vialii]
MKIIRPLAVQLPVAKTVCLPTSMDHCGNQVFDAVDRRSATNLKTNGTLSNSDDFMASCRKLEKPDSGSSFDLRSKKKRFRGEAVPDNLKSPISEKTNHGLPGIFDTAEVQEEMEHAIVSSFHSSSTTSLARVWQLDFVNKLPSTLFTSSRIESADGNSVKIVILNSVSEEVMSSGPLSSLKIEIVVLNGDFGADYQEDWTEKEFNANIVREREGKRPLVTGELVITLRDGVGYVGDASFTDNSSWIRSRKFRLGARPVQSKLPEVRIREARSEAFVVKDHRGESYKKHHPPNLNDEVWRLEKISKGGTYHKALHGKGLSTVEQFLQSYSVDPSSLRRVLGGMSNKIWETVTEHASACVLDDNLYMYHKDGERIGLVFNSIFRVVGATFDGQSYQSLNMLNEFQMGLVENLKRQAYENLHELVRLDGPPVIGPAMLPSSLLAEPYNSSSSSQLQDVNFPVVHPESEEARSQQTDQSTLSAPRLELHGCGSSYGIVVPTCSDLASTQPMSIISHPIPPPAPSQDTSSMTVKATYGDDMIKFELPPTSGIIELKEEVAMRLKLELDRFDLKYKDEDGDWILLPCDKDLRNYLQLFSSMINPIIRLLVVDKVAKRTNLCKSGKRSLKGK